MLVGFDAFFAGFHGLFFEAGSWKLPNRGTARSLYPDALWALMGHDRDVGARPGRGDRARPPPQRSMTSSPHPGAALARRNRIHAILLATLDDRERLQHQGVAAELLMTTIIAAARAAGGRVVLVDAIDDRAARFYRAHDFEPLPTRLNRLVVKLSTAARALGLKMALTGSDAVDRSQESAGGVAVDTRNVIPAAAHVWRI